MCAFDPPLPPPGPPTRPPTWSGVLATLVRGALTTVGPPGLLATMVPGAATTVPLAACHQQWHRQESTYVTGNKEKRLRCARVQQWMEVGPARLPASGGGMHPHAPATNQPCGPS